MTTPAASPLSVPDPCSRWLENRGLIYQLMTDFFGRKPTLSLVAQWSRNRLIGAAAEMTEGGREMKRYFASHAPHEFPAICERETEEYLRLMNDGAVGALIPREAASRGLTEAFCNAVADVYTSAGVVFKKCGGEADDHIAIELEFMAVLHERMMYNSFTVRSAMELLDIQERFLQEHLLLWTPQFCERLNGATDSPLYLGLSRMLQEFLPLDLEMLRVWKASLESEAATL